METCCVYLSVHTEYRGDNVIRHDVQALAMALQNMCVQSLAGEPEKADANNVSSPPQHASDTSSLSSSVLSVNQKVCSSDDSVQGSIFVEHATVQLCDH